MQLELKKHLADAQTAAQRILEFTDGKDLACYQGDAMLRSAVERQFLIIGEALVRVRQTEPDLLQQIPDSPRIIRFRNLLVHAYDVISHEVVWDVVQNHLRPLLRVLALLLAE